MHAVSQEGGPTFIPAIPHHVVRTPHLHGAPTTEEHPQLNADTDASNDFLKEKKKKEESTINGKREERKSQNMKAKSPSSEAHKTFYSCPPRPKESKFHKGKSTFSQ